MGRQVLAKKRDERKGGDATIFTHKELSDAKERENIGAWCWASLG